VEGFNSSVKGLTGSIIVNMIIKEQNFVAFLVLLDYIQRQRSPYKMTVQAQRGGRCVDLPISNLCTIRGWVINATPQPPIAWKRAPIPNVKEAWWIPRLVLIGMGKIKSLVPIGV
jgi:hypothetical protein